MARTPTGWVLVGNAMLDFALAFPPITKSQLGPVFDALIAKSSGRPARAALSSNPLGAALAAQVLDQLGMSLLFHGAARGFAGLHIHQDTDRMTQLACLSYLCEILTFARLVVTKASPLRSCLPGIIGPTVMIIWLLWQRKKSNAPLRTVTHCSH